MIDKEIEKLMINYSIKYPASEIAEIIALNDKIRLCRSSARDLFAQKEKIGYNNIKTVINELIENSTIFKRVHEDKNDKT